MIRTLTTTSIAVTINGNDYSKHVMFPFKVSNLLDEQLDEASLTLIGVPEKNFKPLTDVTVTLTNGNKTQSYYMFVASDKSDEIPTGSGRYKHELYLIEQTKYLECFIVRSIGFVNPLEKSYATIEIEPTREKIFGDIDWGSAGDGNDRINPLMPTPIYVGKTITLPALTSFFSTQQHPTTGGDYITIADYINYNLSRYYTKVTVRDAQYKLLQEWNRQSDIYNTPQEFVVPSTTMLVVEYDIGFIYSAGTGVATTEDFYKYFYYLVVL